MLTRYRGHFLETAMKRVFDVIPFAIFGSIESYLAVTVLVEMHQLALHSAFTSNWGWIGRYVLVSPAAHRIHHSAASKHFDRNMGNTFIVWDRLFGTYHPPEHEVDLGGRRKSVQQTRLTQRYPLGVQAIFQSAQSEQVTEAFRPACLWILLKTVLR